MRAHGTGFECTTCGRNRCVDIRCVTFRYLGDLAPGGWIEYGEGLAGLRVHPVSADKQLQRAADEARGDIWDYGRVQGHIHRLPPRVLRNSQ